MSRLYTLFGLTMEERGALLMLAEISRERGCAPVPDEATFIVSWLGCSTRLWGKIRVSLLAKGKLVEVAHYGQACLALCDELAPKLTEAALHSLPSPPRDVFELGSTNSQARLEAGSTNSRARKVAEAETKPNEINDGVSEPAEIEKNHLLTKGSKKEGSQKEKVGSRIPGDWAATEADLAYAVGQGLTSEIADREAEKFRDYWRNVPGAKGRKLDWNLAWKTWARTAAERQPRNRTSTHERPHQTNRDDRMARAYAGAMDLLDEHAGLDAGGGDGAEGGSSGGGGYSPGLARLGGPLRAVR